MNRVLLQAMLDDIPFEALPPAWTTFDLAAFSQSKRLWDYQQAALQNGLKALWKYYEDFADYSTGEGEQVHSERVDYIRHVIRHPSEVRFVNHLEAYLQQEDNGFSVLDWWLFSKLDETLDQVYIPYYDPETNRIRQFKPDFIFWLQKGDHYFIVFVDPKGMQLTGYQHKIDGYKQLFLDPSGAVRTLSHNGLKVRIRLFLHTDDANRAPQEYREYWFDHPANLLSPL